MSKAVICPVCNGDGKPKNSPPPHLIFEKCNGCSGRGWVEVSDNSDTFRYHPPFILPTTSSFQYNGPFVEYIWYGYP